jgi:hypothetical protein
VVSAVSSALKIGLIVDDECVSKHLHELVQWAGTIDNIVISHLIVQQRADPSRKRGGRVARLLHKGPAGIATTLLWKAKQRLESRRLRAIRAYQGHQQNFAIGELVPGRIHVSPVVSESGYVYRFSQEDLERIRSERFDLLIRGGSGILKGDILSSARLGILSFHHGDNRINRGGPPGFWEVYFRQSRTGFVIQRLTEELDGGDVVLRGYIPTQATHLLNCAMLFNKSYHHLRLLLLRIAETGQLPPAEPHYPYAGQLFHTPDLQQLATYTARSLGRSVSSRVRRALGRRERWNICFTKADWPNAVLRRGIPVRSPQGRFLADPFVATRDGRSCIFAEDFVYSTSKGHISVFEIAPDGARELGVVVSESFHLSFPYLFEFEGTLYMCPEAAGSRQIRIYECTEFPMKWRLAVIAMKDVSAVDTMIFRENGSWWLLTNLSTTEPDEWSAELHLFSANSPLTERWQPHRRNPLLIDPQRARNGGLLHDHGGLIRVAQKQGFQSYGAAANLMRMTRIDDQEYSEELVSRITPSFMPGLHGTHHLHSNGIYTVWDFKRWERV